MPLKTDIKRSVEPARKGHLAIALEGSLDTATAPELEKQLATAVDADVTHVVFNLVKLTFISSAGLRIFGAVRKKLKERGGQLSLVNLQPQIQAVIDVIRSLPGMTIFSNTAELDAYLAARQKAVIEGQE